MQGTLQFYLLVGGTVALNLKLDKDFNSCLSLGTKLGNFPKNLQKQTVLKRF